MLYREIRFSIHEYTDFELKTASKLNYPYHICNI